jgi:hypothetical protein
MITKTFRCVAAAAAVWGAMLVPAGTAAAEDAVVAGPVTRLCVSDGFTVYCEVMNPSTGEIVATYSYPVPPPFQPPPPPPPPLP